MSRLTDLPSELLREILLLVLLNNQPTPNPAQNNSSLAFTSNPTSPSEPASEDEFEDTPLRAQALHSYSHEKILSKSFVQGSELIHTTKCMNGLRSVSDHYLFSKIHFHHLYKADLIALSLTCRRLNEAAVHLVWKMVELHALAREYGGEAGYSRLRMPQFLESVVKNHQLATEVKALSFTVFWRETEEWRGIDGSKMLVELETLAKQLAPLVSSPPSINYEHDVRAFVWGTEECFSWPLLLTLLPNLRTMKIVLESAPPFWTRFITSDLTLSVRGVPLLPVFTNIRELSIIWDHPETVPFASEILVLFQLAHLHTLYLGHVLTLNILQKPEHLDVKSNFGTSCIKELTFDLSIVHPVLLKTLLKLPRKLEKFRYSLGNQYAGLCDGRDIIEALSPHSSSLRSLNINGSKYFTLRKEDGFPIGKGLLEFPVLEDLGISIWLLLFEGVLPKYKLTDVLPPSLMRLNLFVYDDWRFEGWGKELETLFAEKKEGRWQRLQFLGVEYWVSAELFSSESSGPEGDKESRDAMLGRLMETAKEVGVELVVEVDCLSFTEL